MTLRLLLASLLALCLTPGCGGSSDTDGGTDTSEALDVPAPIDAPSGSDVPGLDAPAVTDAPTATDAPSETDALVLLDVPVALDAPDPDPEHPNCDQRDVLCDAIPPSCGDGEAPSVNGTCWGPCVLATTCVCTSADECPDVPGYSETCHTGAGHCGPYL